ncbi:MAG: DUF2807 domain-containing protein [Anaeroplasmataceae bacterium]|nr:DUF2807 domain-containing protein [Anaeroplasmataceae bacterium]MDE5867705.1 DUF2807 domain-containing protein [Anaeroplasmataceae bacterium]
MKKILFLFICFSLLVLVGCAGFPHRTIIGTGEVIEKTYELKEATKLEVKDFHIQKGTAMEPVTLRLHPSEEQKVVIQANESLFSRFTCKISFKTLKIHGVRNDAYDCEGISIDVYGYVFEDIDISFADTIVDAACLSDNKLKLNCSGASKINITNDYQATQIRIDCSGASSVNLLKCNFDSIRADLSGASSLEIEQLVAEEAKMNCSGASNAAILNGGTIKQLNLDCSGASNVLLSKVTSLNVKVDLSGASSATIAFTGSVDGSISGASNLKYIGDSSKINVKQSGGASLIRIS